MAHSRPSLKAVMAASLQVGEAEKLEWLVASCTALVGCHVLYFLSSCRNAVITRPPWSWLAACLNVCAANLSILNVL